MNKNIKKLFVWIILPLILLSLNIYLVRDLFHLEYTNQMGSIESVFIADARYINEHGPFSTWNNEWYMGFPFRFFYPPLFHYLNALIKTIFSSLSVSLIYHFVCASFYSVGAVGLYFFIRYLTRKTWPAFVAGFMFTLLPSASYLIEIVKNYGSKFYLAPWRLVVLLEFGEGPHISALSLLPLVLLVFLWALRKPSFKSYVIASLSLAIIPLINWPTAIALTFALLSLIFASMMAGQAKFKLKRSLLIILTAYLFSAFWLSFSYVYTTFTIAGPRAGGGFMKGFLSYLPWLIIISPFIIGIMVAIFNKKKKLMPWSFILFYLLFFSTIVYSAYFSDIKIIPESNRFTPEWNLGIIILLSFIFGMIYHKIKTKKRVLTLSLRSFFVLLVLSSVLYLGWPFLSHSGKIIKENKDITQTGEHEIASWLKNNTDGERVYITGSYAFWLNAWTDVPQVRGGSDQGATNPWFSHALYQINTSANMPYGQDTQLALDWLKAFNVDYLVFNTSKSREVFHDFKNQEKFEGVLKEVYNKKGDIIYQVPLETSSLAQAVPADRYKSLSEPKNAIDVQAVASYAKVVDEQARNLSFKRLENEKAQINGQLKEGEVINLQITHHAGWQAEENGRNIPIKKDSLGFMYLETGPGQKDIIITHGLTWDEKLGIALTIITIIIIIVLRFKKGKKWLYHEYKKEKEEDEEY